MNAGGATRSRTGLLGFAIRCITALLSRQYPSLPGNHLDTQRSRQKREAWASLFGIWSGKRVSNSRPQPWQGCALPTELFPHFKLQIITQLSGAAGCRYAEMPGTAAMQMRRRQCFTDSPKTDVDGAPATGTAAVVAATAGSSSGNGTGIRTSAISSTLSIQRTGTISRPFLTFSGMS